MAPVPKDPKRCTRCGEHKPRSEFYPHSQAQGGVHSRCRVCTNLTSTEYAKANRDKACATQRKSKLKRNWGMTLDQFDSLLRAQGGGCAICGSKEPGGTGRFHVDHCHATGSVRGLLCTRCNTGLGQFRDRPDLLRQAANYVEVGGPLGICG